MKAIQTVTKNPTVDEIKSPAGIAKVTVDAYIQERMRQHRIRQVANVLNSSWSAALDSDWSVAQRHHTFYEPIVIASIRQQRTIANEVVDIVKALATSTQGGSQFDFELHPDGTFLIHQVAKLDRSTAEAQHLETRETVSKLN
jgi:hypothetical protein